MLQVEKFSLRKRCGRIVWAVLRRLPVAVTTVLVLFAQFQFVAMCYEIIEDAALRRLYLAACHVFGLLFHWSHMMAVFSPVGRPLPQFYFPVRVRRKLVALKQHPLKYQAVVRQFVKRRRLATLQHRANESRVCSDRVCETCWCVKPDRAHHCSTCGHCVLKFDHHCVLINTCVNYANYKYFLLAMGYGMALCLLGICGTVPHLGKAWRVFRFRLSVVETGWW